MLSYALVAHVDESSLRIIDAMVRRCHPEELGRISRPSIRYGTKPPNVANVTFARVVHWSCRAQSLDRHVQPQQPALLSSTPFKAASID